MPLTNSYNALALNNQQPEYEMYWTPLGVDIASSAGITPPTAAGAVGWIPGAVLAFNTAGVGATPGPGGDGVYTVQFVDPAPTSTTTYLAGILLGVGALGAASPVVPNTIPGTVPAQVAMVGKRGICQVYVDNTTTIGHTLLCSTTHIGNASDSGGTTRTYGTHFGIALQAVTVSAAPKLCWAYVNFP